LNRVEAILDRHGRDQAFSFQLSAFSRQPSAKLTSKTPNALELAGTDGWKLIAKRLKERCPMEPLDTALSPSRIAAIVENWPHLRAMGIAIEECEVRNIRPGTEGDLQLEYRFTLVKARTADRFKASIVGRVYQDQRGEQEYTRLLERWKDKERLLADPSLQGFVLYVPEHRLLLHSSLTDEKLPGLQTALDPEAMIGLLGACLQANQPAAERIHHCETYALRHNPGKLCTLRYRLEWIDPQTRATRQQSMIGKLYGDGKEGARIFGLMQGLEKHGFGVNSTDGIRIPRLYGYISELRI